MVKYIILVIFHKNTSKISSGDVMKRHISASFVIFLFGGVLYGLIEILVRGYTHWTMILTGGAVFLALFFLNTRLRTRSLILRGILGALIITGAEFAVGVTVNLIFKMNVWDYSDKPGNILGQICPKFCLGWFFLSVAAVYLVIFLYWQLNKRLRLSPDSD